MRTVPRVPRPRRLFSPLLATAALFTAGCGNGETATDDGTTHSSSTTSTTSTTSDSDPGATQSTTTGSTLAPTTGPTPTTGPAPTSTTDTTTEPVTASDGTTTTTTTTGDTATSTTTTGDTTTTTGDTAGTSEDTGEASTTGAPCSTWERTYGLAEAEYGNAVVHIPGQGFAVAGRTTSKGAGLDDMWLVRLDEAGELLWDRTYGTASSEIANGIALAPDGGFLLVGTGYTQQTSLDWWVVRTDATGAMQWDKTFATTDADHAFAAVAVAEGGFAVAGVRDRVAKGTGRFWLIRLADDGAVQWEEIYGDLADEQLAYGLVELPGDGFALAGTASEDFWLVRTDLDGNVLWDRSYDLAGHYDRATALARTADDGLVLAGWSEQGTTSDFWVVRTDADGEPVWTQAYDREARDFAEDVAVLADGGLVIVGSSQVMGGDTELWIVRTDAAGALVWQRSFGGAAHDAGNGVAALPNSDLVFVGRTQSQGAGSDDAWALRTDADGLLSCE